jgi:hypothetical protein
VGGNKAVSISFPSGKDVLNAYWGFLAHGGLVIRDPIHGLDEGDAVSLEVTIESLQRHYSLRGQVVRRPNLDTPTGEHAVIAFDPGEPGELLLSAAWADADNVPARRHRRFPCGTVVRFRWTGAEGAGPDSVPAEGRLVNVSSGGCCVRVRTAGPHKVVVGEPVEVLVDDNAFAAVVRWSRAADFGLEFVPGTDGDQILRRVL